MGVNVKLGVDLSGFKQGITEANAQLKTFDAQIKLAESSFKKTGDAEAAMYQKTDALTGKLKVQKQMIQQYWQALEKMRLEGVEPTSKSYQQMEAAMLNMQSAANETEIALNGLSVSQLTAASSADKLTQSVNGIGKKISLDQVINGIDKITGGFENAAKKAAQLGESIWNNIMNSAKWADDTSTMALMYGIDLDTFQRMQKLVTNGLDTSVDAMLTAQSRLKRGIGSDAKAVSDALNEMGISMTTYVGGGKYGPIEQAKDSLELFWEVGQKLMTWGDEYQKEDMAQKLFGRGWKELVPLFRDYKSLEDYNAALDKVNVNSEEDVNALVELNEKVAELKGNFDTLSNEVWAKMAPALTDAANALNGVMDSILKYIETPQGQETLNKLGEAVSGLFADLGKIDPEKVVQGFVDSFTKVTGGIQWLVENQDLAKGILGTIVTAWGGLVIGENVLKVFKFVDGLKGLTGIGEAEGLAAGASWGSGFAKAVIKAAPWLTGLITLLTPSTAYDNGLINGTITQEGYFEFARQAMENPEYKATMLQLGTVLGAESLQKLMGNAEAITQIWNYLISGQTGYGNALNFANQALEKYTGAHFAENWIGVEFTEEELNSILQGMNLVLTPTFSIPENAADLISQQIGPIVLPVQIDPGTASSGEDGNPKGYANGLPFVPYDNFLALLHRGERVVPAREVSSNRNFSSNLYIEHNYMNNGTDADALADMIAKRNKRVMAGFGS